MNVFNVDVGYVSDEDVKFKVKFKEMCVEMFFCYQYVQFFDSDFFILVVFWCSLEGFELIRFRMIEYIF